MGRAASLIAFALSVLAWQGSARADDGSTAVPPAMRGVWGKMGRCDIEADRLKITASSAAFGTNAPKPVVYSPEEKIVRWDEEYAVDDFVPGINSDVLIYNSEGFNMPGKIGYERCGADLVRLPWPFKAGPVKAPE